MFEIIDGEGRILGLVETKVINWSGAMDGAHGRYVRLVLETNRPTLSELMSTPMEEPCDPVAYRVIELMWFEARLAHSRGDGREPMPLRSRWYLMARDELPEHVWKAKGFIDLRQTWKR